VREGAIYIAPRARAASKLQRHAIDRAEYGKNFKDRAPRVVRCLDLDPSSLGSTMMNVMTRAQIGGKDAVFEVPRRSGHLEHGIYTSELWELWD